MISPSGEDPHFCPTMAPTTADGFGLLCYPRPSLLPCPSSGSERHFLLFGPAIAKSVSWPRGLSAGPRVVRAVGKRGGESPGG